MKVVVFGALVVLYPRRCGSPPITEKTSGVAEFSSMNIPCSAASARTGVVIEV
jgi:hypothetical protein